MIYVQRNTPAHLVSNPLYANMQTVGEYYPMYPFTSAGGGQVKVWNGSAFVAKPAKVWNGSAWVQKTVKTWNGSSWVATNY